MGFQVFHYMIFQRTSTTPLLPIIDIAKFRLNWEVRFFNNTLLNLRQSKGLHVFSDNNLSK